MRVLIYDVDCKDSGIDYPLKVAFEELGHQADMFDWRRFLYSYPEASLINRIKDRAFFELTAFRINQELKKIIRKNKYDLLLVLRGEHIYSETILFAKKFISHVVNWNTDDLFNKLNSSRHIISAFDKYDRHFSPRPHLKEEYLSRGAKSFEVLHWYYRMGLLFPQPIIGNYTYNNDISFIGSWSKRRENILSILSHDKVNVYGWGWNSKVKVHNFDSWTFNKGIKINHMMNIMSVTKININILTLENRDSNNFRNYEIPASGGFQLSERSDLILDLFEEDKEIVCFSDPEELKSKCDFYLKNDSSREKIALAGYNKLVKGNNSLSDRIRSIIDSLKA